MEFDYLPGIASAIEGSTEHLYFSLHQVYLGGDNSPEGTPSAPYAFFSLDEAIAVMVQLQLPAYNYKVAASPHQYIAESVITDLASGRPLASIWVNGNGHRDNHDLPQGVFFQFADGLNTARLLTGLPFFADDVMQSRHHLPLAFFEGNKLVPTAAFESLAAAAAERLERTNGIAQDFDMQVTYKGFSFHRGNSGAQRKLEGKLLEHHHYSNMYEAARHLISGNLYRYDGFCPDNTHHVHITHAYVIKKQQDLALYLKTVAVGQESIQHPSAGIWLVSSGAIRSLEDDARMSLSHLSGYAPGDNSVLLATYLRQDRYHMLAQHQAKGHAGISFEKAGVKVSPKDNFLLRIDYQENYNDNRVEALQASDHYYHGTAKTAIGQLLDINPQHLLPPPGSVGYGFTIGAAVVYDSAQVVVAQLKTVPVAETLQLQMEITPKDHIFPFFKQAMQAMGEVKPDLIPSNSKIIIPVAQMNEHGVMQQLPSAVFLRHLIRSVDVRAITREMARPADPAQYASLHRAFYVEQQWQKKQGEQPGERRERWTINGLDKAATLLALPGNKPFFSADGPDGYQLSIISITDPINNATIARRNISTVDGRQVVMREYDLSSYEGRQLALDFKTYQKIVPSAPGSMKIRFVEAHSNPMAFNRRIVPEADPDQTRKGRKQ